MAYNIQNYWVYGLSPSFGILRTRKHNVSETAPDSQLKTKNRSSFRDVMFSNI
jgi:hypothetical protein